RRGVPGAHARSVRASPRRVHLQLRGKSGAAPFLWESRLQEEPRPSELVLGAFHDERLAGVAGLSFEKREKARHKATLFGMYVSSRFRRHGLGRQIVEAVLAEASSRGVKVVQLMVTHGNHAAQALYEECGFVQFGLEPFAVAVGDGYVSKAHMWCNLGGLPTLAAA